MIGPRALTTYTTPHLISSYNRVNPQYKLFSSHHSSRICYHSHRRHVEIYWDSNEKSFFIRNISTENQSYVPFRGSDSYEPEPCKDREINCDGDKIQQQQGRRRKGGSVYLRGVEVPPGERGVLLKSQSIVQVGSSIFTFVLPSSKSAANKQDVDVSTYNIYSHLLIFPFHAPCPMHYASNLRYYLVLFLLHIRLFPIPLLPSPIYHIPLISSSSVFLNPLFSSFRPLHITGCPSPCPLKLPLRSGTYPSNLHP